MLLNYSPYDFLPSRTFETEEEGIELVTELNRMCFLPIRRWPSFSRCSLTDHFICSVYEEGQWLLRGQFFFFFSFVDDRDFLNTATLLSLTNLDSVHSMIQTKMCWHVRKRKEKPFHTVYASWSSNPDFQTH